MGKSDPYYASDHVDNEILGNASDVSGQKITLNWAPVLLETFTIESSDGVVIGSADATGKITGTGISKGSITPDGKLEVTLTNPSADTDIIVNYLYDNESVASDGPLAAGFANHPEAELKINSLPVQARARTMRAFWAFDAQYELQKE